MSEPTFPNEDWFDKYDKLYKKTEEQLQNIRNMPQEVKDYFSLFIGYSLQSCGSESLDHQFFRRTNLTLGQLVDVLEELGEIQEVI